MSPLFPAPVGAVTGFDPCPYRYPSRRKEANEWKGARVREAGSLNDNPFEVFGSVLPAPITSSVTRILALVMLKHTRPGTVEWETEETLRRIELIPPSPFS